MKFDLLRLYDENWLIRRLYQHGVGLLDGGVTTAEERRENVRAAIQKVGANIIVGRGKEGKAMSYGECFKSVYGVLP